MPNVDRVKLFVAIDLDAATRAAAARINERLQASGLHGRFESSEKLHITLAFLGYTAASTFADVRSAMRNVARRHKPFVMQLDRVGAFPNERAPRIAYLGARDQGAAFRNLARKMREAYEQLGFTFNKDAVAHVTLARIGAGERQPLPVLDDIEPITLAVDRLTLFESLADRAKDTTRYEVRAVATLRG